MNFLHSLQNPQVKAWKKLLTKKGRDQANLFIVEGFHLVEEAFKSGAVKEIMIREGIEIPHWMDDESITVTGLTDEISKAIAETEHTQGVFAVCSQESRELTDFNAERILLIDAVQDPGNIGTMIRTADAAGIDLVVLGKGSADPYNAKVLRSAQGSHFHLSIVKEDLNHSIPALKEKGIPVYGTALQNASPYQKVNSGGPFALIMGNEGAGVNGELLQLADENLYVPIYGKSESLNVAVAAGILLFHLKG
ncbi:TrmH family RNA methyltransferase [Jeotgalibacillus campisalis]|uniref:23S rRNA methyltransferase n=1 Tax=Jeotgalibacillus campisalis TaxID=220754 RepID=A0A0C2VQI4_9BACL|nr:RNA methyltransferase [Jeotgalibacillus campisalis]KIL46273.1 23S rRNA methyltransferase [Jeotgalibacillus campisalis]